MEIQSITTTGKGVDDLPSLLKSRIPDSTLIKEGASVILLTEKLYLRVGSNLLSVIVFSMESEASCRIRVISGGGGYGLGITLGSESSCNQRLVNLIMSICNQKDWKVVSS